MAQALAVLDPAERAILSGLLDKVLTGLYAEIGNADLLCRLCDRASCTTDATCPVGQAERERNG
ncbi:hypothetical protein OH799_02050 [Nocardia sp. NBC_00881]|uniref:hypothetical protein n=1 Tax=Nocardia sp. NBC_00881 TaxID=2975995 RepID=UPI00386BD30A|nr:hypothetical protein OH799_02050 [Nocardia sp. NBC_00881]